MKLIIFILLGAAQAANAGGDGEEATVKRFIVYGSSYTLVLAPQKHEAPSESYIPALRGCALFTVLGSFNERWKKAGKKGPTALSHRKAIAALERANQTKALISFGYMGSTGFEGIDGKKPWLSCVVESSGLELLEYKGRTLSRDTIVSYGDGI